MIGLNSNIDEQNLKRLGDKSKIYKKTAENNVYIILYHNSL